MSRRSAEKIAEDAIGDIDPSELTETEGSGLLFSSTLLYDQPVIDYLQENEDLLYLYSNTESECFKVDKQGKSYSYVPYRDLDGKNIS